MIPLLVRLMLPSERSMILKDWKSDVAESRQEPDGRRWGASLQGDEFWVLLNYVMDNISLPTCDVWMACNRSEPEVPLAWLAVRGREILHRHARAAVQREPALAALLERRLIDHSGAEPVDWNPFLELKNHGKRAA